MRRSPHGERGLKSIVQTSPATDASRSPHGERGLKFYQAGRRAALELSLPPRGAWIEIFYGNKGDAIAEVGRSPHGERGLKCKEYNEYSYNGWSLPPRGAWIEICLTSSAS